MTSNYLYFIVQPFINYVNALIIGNKKMVNYTVSKNENNIIILS